MSLCSSLILRLGSSMYDLSVLDGRYSAPVISGEFPGHSSSAAVNSV